MKLKKHWISDGIGGLASNVVGIWGLSKLTNSYANVYVAEKNYELSQDILTKYTIISSNELVDGIVYTATGVMLMGATYFISKGIKLTEVSNEKSSSG